MLNILVVQLLVLLASAASFRSIDQAQKDKIVAWANTARAEIANRNRCGNMLELTWDDQLYQATRKVLCPTDHSRSGLVKTEYGRLIGANPSVGDNLAWQSENQGGTEAIFKNVVYDRWFKGERDNNGNGECKTIFYDEERPSETGGHCTAMTWQNQEKMACSWQKDCPGKHPSGFHCYFSTAGNVNSVKTCDGGGCYPPPPWDRNGVKTCNHKCRNRKNGVRVLTIFHGACQSGEPGSKCPASHRKTSQGLCSRKSGGGGGGGGGGGSSQCKTTDSRNKPCTRYQNRPGQCHRNNANQRCTQCGCGSSSLNAADADAQEALRLRTRDRTLKIVLATVGALLVLCLAGVCLFRRRSRASDKDMLELRDHASDDPSPADAVDSTDFASDRGTQLA